jgi:hypothetical protein
MVCNLYHTLFGDQIKEVEMSWAVSVIRVEEKESGYKVLMRKPERKGRHGTPWR